MVQPYKAYMYGISPIEYLCMKRNLQAVQLGELPLYETELELVIMKKAREAQGLPSAVDPSSSHPPDQVQPSI